MSLARTCARCAAPLPDDTPDGALCPACVSAGAATRIEPALADSTIAPRVAETIGDFEIIDKLGQGGMGAVYRARQKSLGRVIALKVLPAQFAEDAESVSRFQREAKVAASLQHANLVRVFNAGHADGCHFIAMELIDGENLHQRLRRQRLSIVEALHICAEVARGLQFGWESAHLIHRDIKPSNIYLSNAGEVKVGDLGLAKSVMGNTTGLTQTGTMMGTPCYMSPEQCRGDKALDFRADIYSLGCMLYELLTGQPPYGGTDPVAIVHQHIHAPLPAILKVMPQCPMLLVRVVGRMLKKQKHERYASYEELIVELDWVREQIEQGTLGRAPGTAARKEIAEAPSPARIPSPSAPPPRGKPLVWIGIAAGVLVIAGLAFTFTRPAKSKSGPAIAPEKAAQSSSATPTPAPAALAANGPPGEVFALSGHTAAVRDIAFIPGRNDRAVSASWDKTVRYWDLAARKELRSFAHTNFVNAVAATPLGHHVIAGDSNGRLVRWNLETGKIDAEARLPAGEIANSISISPTRPFGCVGTTLGRVYTFSLPAMTLAPAPAQIGAQEVHIAFFPDGEHVLAGSMSRDGAPWQLCKLRAGEATPLLTYAVSGGAGVNSCDVSADGEWVAAAISAAGVQVWKAAGGEPVTKIPKGYYTLDLRFTGKGEGIATAHNNGVMVLWDRASGKELRRETSSTGWVTTNLALSSDSRFALTAGGFRVITKKEDDGHYTLHLWRLPQFDAATPAAVPKAAASAGGKWIDALARWWALPETKRAADLLAKEAGGSRVNKRSMVVASGNLRNTAVRATVRGNTARSWLLGLRRTGDPFSNYIAALQTVPGDRRARVIRTLNGTREGTAVLKSYDLPADFSLGDSHTMEFRAEGDLLTVVLDGREIISVRDSAITSGYIWLEADPGALIEKLEYRELGGAAPPK